MPRRSESDSSKPWGENIPIRSGPPPKREANAKRAKGGQGAKGGQRAKGGPRAKGKPEPGKRGKGGPQRLQRILAAAGFGSRRQCEELILEGRVEVDGQVVTELGSQADPAAAKIFVDGSEVRPQRHVYFMLNKPPGVVTTNRDPQGRTRVVDLIQERERVFPVGRLDRSSEGLILLTNDGDFAQQLAHPRFGVRKIYRVTVAGKVDQAKLEQMRKGIYIAEGRVAVDGAKILRHRSKSTDMEILLREGKNREIRRILARLGHKVMTLQRIAMGPLRLGELPRGTYRPLTSHEVKRLREEIFHQSRQPRGDDREGDEAGAKPSRGSARSKATGEGQPSSGNRPAGNRPPVDRPPVDRPAKRDSEDPAQATGNSGGEANRSKDSSLVLVDPGLASDGRTSGTVIGDDRPPSRSGRSRDGKAGGDRKPGGKSAGKRPAGKRSTGKPSAGKSSTGKRSTGKPSAGKRSEGSGKRGASGKQRGGGGKSSDAAGQGKSTRSRGAKAARKKGNRR